MIGNVKVLYNQRDIMSGPSAAWWRACLGRTELDSNKPARHF